MYFMSYLDIFGELDKKGKHSDQIFLFVIHEFFTFSISFVVIICKFYFLTFKF
jgi:hypothetical protein